LKIFFPQPIAVLLINKYPFLQLVSLYPAFQDIANGHYVGPDEFNSIVTCYGSGIRKLKKINTKSTMDNSTFFPHSLSLHKTSKCHPKIFPAFHMAAFRELPHQNNAGISRILI
jgi:hypothetical protein